MVPLGDILEVGSRDGHIAYIIIRRPPQHRKTLRPEASLPPTVKVEISLAIDAVVLNVTSVGA